MLIATDGRRLAGAPARVPDQEFVLPIAAVHVPVTTEGQPPEMAFDPKYLADAIEIGPTLRLMDKLNPGMAISTSGNFCVLMSQRFTEETAKEEAASETPTPAMVA